jgi:hypothetical protein
MREFTEGEELMPDVVVAESVWWNNHSPSGAGIN